MKLWDTTLADFAAIFLAGFSVVCGVAVGIMVLIHDDNCAALFGIIGSMATGGGIFAAYDSAKKRDEQIRFWIEQTADAQARSGGGFGS